MSLACFGRGGCTGSHCGRWRVHRRGSSGERRVSPGWLALRDVQMPPWGVRCVRPAGDSFLDPVQAPTPARSSCAPSSAKAGQGTCVTKSPSGGEKVARSELQHAGALLLRRPATSRRPPTPELSAIPGPGPRETNSSGSRGPRARSPGKAGKRLQPFAARLARELLAQQPRDAGRVDRLGDVGVSAQLHRRALGLGRLGGRQARRSSRRRRAARAAAAARRARRPPAC